MEERMSLADYQSLCDAIVHMSVDIESYQPRYNDTDGWNDETAMKYALVKYMIDCINDTPKSLVEYAVSEGLKLPEAEY